MSSETIKVRVGTDTPAQRAMLHAVTNDEDWILALRCLTDANAGFDLDSYGADISVTDAAGVVVLSGTVDDGTIVKSDDSGGVTSILTSTFAASAMSVLDEGRYRVGVRLTTATPTKRQILLATIYVREGAFDA